MVKKQDSLPLFHLWIHFWIIRRRKMRIRYMKIICGVQYIKIWTCMQISVHKFSAPYFWVLHRGTLRNTYIVLLKDQVQKVQMDNFCWHHDKTVEAQVREFVKSFFLPLCRVQFSSAGQKNIWVRCYGKVNFLSAKSFLPQSPQCSSIIYSSGH